MFAETIVETGDQKRAGTRVRIPSKSTVHAVLDRHASNDETDVGRARN